MIVSMLVRFLRRRDAAAESQHNTHRILLEHVERHENEAPIIDNTSQTTRKPSRIFTFLHQFGLSLTFDLDLDLILPKSQNHQ